MKKKLKRKYSRRKTKNEFDEIRELRLKNAPKITSDDITDFIIDLGLANKELEKLVEQNKKNKKPPKSQGKKRCVKQKVVSVKKFVTISTSIKKDSKFVITDIT